MEGNPDFIVSELLSELKAENARKDAQIKTLHKSIIKLAVAAIAAVLLVIGSCLLYLNQYDFSSTENLTVEKSAEGVYALIDSDGNVVGYDFLEEVSDSGESYSESGTSQNQYED